MLIPEDFMPIVARGKLNYINFNLELYVKEEKTLFVLLLNDYTLSRLIKKGLVNVQDGKLQTVIGDIEFNKMEEIENNIVLFQRFIGYAEKGQRAFRTQVALVFEEEGN